MGYMILGITPYLSAFSSQHRDEKFLQEICNSFSSAHGLMKKSGKKVWVSDTFNEVNGVTKTIKTLASLVIKMTHLLRFLLVQTNHCLPIFL